MAKKVSCFCAMGFTPWTAPTKTCSHSNNRQSRAVHFWNPKPIQTNKSSPLQNTFKLSVFLDSTIFGFVGVLMIVGFACEHK